MHNFVFSEVIYIVIYEFIEEIFKTSLKKLSKNAKCLIIDMNTKYW